ncbi:MAG: ribonuclease HII [Candidatus Bipolaricaulaceae bacterium]
METVLGIDEAGRGAMIGPLVIAGVAVPQGELAALHALGARDSKAVARSRRRALVRKIARHFPIDVVVIPASAVDAHNLTQLELTAAATIAGAAGRRTGQLRVVLDAPVPSAALPRFLRTLSQLSGLPEARLAAYPRADRTHPAVAAASLAAKVVRDAHVAHLRARYGDFGWGYPGEARCLAFLRDWLRNSGSLPPICRRRWRPAARLLAEQLQLADDFGPFLAG